MIGSLRFGQVYRLEARAEDGLLDTKKPADQLQKDKYFLEQQSARDLADLFIKNGIPAKVVHMGGMNGNGTEDTYLADVVQGSENGGISAAQDSQFFVLTGSDLEEDNRWRSSIAQKGLNFAKDKPADHSNRHDLSTAFSLDALLVEIRRWRASLLPMLKLKAIPVHPMPGQEKFSFHQPDYSELAKLPNAVAYTGPERKYFPQSKLAE